MHFQHKQLTKKRSDVQLPPVCLVHRLRGWSLNLEFTHLPKPSSRSSKKKKKLVLSIPNEATETILPYHSNFNEWKTGQITHCTLKLSSKFTLVPRV